MAGPATDRWAEALAAWAIPPAILGAAPESPWGFPAALFSASAREAMLTETPSRARAADALGPDGSVLDVGAGAGAASLRLAPPARHITAVDASPDMLTAFAALADERQVAHDEVLGTWPAMRDAVDVADVCVCHHVVYNVGDLHGFALALTDRARRRVVVELTATHPQSSLNDFWRHFHQVERPEHPTADDAIAVLAAAGLEVGVDRWTSPAFNANADREVVVSFARRRLCLPVDREPEIDALLDTSEIMEPRSMVTLWWDGAGA